ncbi:hypothetical protein HMN09_00346600 [Mycena chlorophos]|uniref:Uncharacterized protein n=1 Tax=Mycena chlorophos TaxID=658473 RepID=A0A8H6WIP9_MYCCL|nr:hypothetical protein HMN09_00346600 [Mycena chlorophos]
MNATSSSRVNSYLQRSAEKDVFSVQPDPPPSETRLAMSSSISTAQDTPAMASSSGPTFHFAELLSAQLIGSLCDFMLGGAFLVQLVIYRICFSKDSRVDASVCVASNIRKNGFRPVKVWIQPATKSGNVTRGQKCECNPSRTFVSNPSRVLMLPD